ncbi:MAG TPA: nitrogenase component 1 [Methanomassiliicoccales archaeon]|jgi:nitrogenase molybdenum-iron protein NifN
MIANETFRAKQVNENQCNMCMPLGGVIAFKGIEGAMVLVHGSQGCSTYMRLANVEHFNEPVDIASSALNEKQTIFGGEPNLHKAMDNVLRVYRPKVLGIVTTCLSETIGDDVKGMVQKYQNARPDCQVDFIPVSTPSYAGSHSEGFWAATKAVVQHYASLLEKHQGINIIVPHISPADIREIKRMLVLMGIEHTLIPDYSMTLDRPFGGRYQKIPSGGTPTRSIERMGGASATIQFGRTCPANISPGAFLEGEFGVPLYNLPLPIGLESTDLFLKTLRELTGRTVPESLTLERGWLLDAMADSHKYNAEGLPAVYGEPELVYAFTTLCAENGAFPAVVASGTQISRLKDLIAPLFPEDEQPELIGEADFASIEEACVRSGVNIAIGHSGGKVLTERQGIPLVRVGYPINDRVGGQRILSAGYAGTLAFLDRFTNTLLESKYGTYRQRKKQELFEKGGK